MNYQQVMQELKSLGTTQNVKIYKRHGAGNNLYGVSFAHLGKLKKRIKTDHVLAQQLWQSGNADARALATMIADPTQATDRMLEEWVRSTQYYLLIDLVAGVAGKTGFARKKMEQWTKSKDEWVGQAGWDVLAHLALRDETLPDAYLEGYLRRIEKGIHQSKNRTRHAMNSALIAIGIRNGKLEKKALAAATRIGKVEVDHGETSCTTPDAAAYIKKARQRKNRN